MWKEPVMSIPESIIISVMGLFVVIGVLAMLAVLIVLFSRILNIRGDTKQDRQQTGSKPEGLTEEDVGAAIVAVICEEMKAGSEQIRITYIREIGM